MADDIPARSTLTWTGKAARTLLLLVLLGLTVHLLRSPDFVGDGARSGCFSSKTADLTSDDVQALANKRVFLILTEGAGLGTSLAENLILWQVWTWSPTSRPEEN